MAEERSQSADFNGMIRPVKGGTDLELGRGWWSGIL